jgi:N-hydroxyarylamine O-acetyltransferase
MIGSQGGRLVSEASFDLDAYLARIGYAGARKASPGVLNALHAAHAAAMPFENLDPLLRRPVNLDLPSLEKKLVAAKRGGYCFEVNALFAAALDALGFKVRRLGARVRWGMAPDVPEGPRTHMALLVELDGEAYVADVGFGGYVLSAPLKLAADVMQQDCGNAMRFVMADGRYTLQLQRPAGWSDVYRFSLEPQFASDYGIANWWTATHPQSLFVGNLLVEHLTPERRMTLFNRRLTVRYPDGRVEERTLASAAELAATLAACGIEPPAAAEEIWARVPEA